MNKKLKLFLSKNSEYTGFQHVTKQTLLIKRHGCHGALCYTLCDKTYLPPSRLQKDLNTQARQS